MQENTSFGVAFFNKGAGLKPLTILKKETPT